MASRDSFFARGLEPFAAGLWTVYVLVSVVVAAVWTLGVGEGSIDNVVANPDLRRALVWMLARLDFVWILLAATNAYVSLVEAVGLGTARRWALIVVAAVLAVAWLSVATGFPLGHIRYGSALGLKLGPVPVGLPLLWFSIVLGAREAVLWVRPRWGQVPLALTIGVLAIITDLNLEPIAAKLRGFWFWSAASPGQPPVFQFPILGSIAWGMVAGVLALNLRELNPVARSRKPWKGMVVLAIFEVVFLLARVAYRLSH